jgi:hypothetical protein
MEFPDKTHVARSHDFGHDQFRAQTFDPSQGLSHAVGDAADLQVRKTSDPAGHSAPHESVPIHEKNPLLPPGWLRLRFLARVHDVLAAFQAVGYRANCVVHVQANVSPPPRVATMGCNAEAVSANRAGISAKC